MKEYNLLTRKLLSEGYSVENYPDYVKMAGGRLSSSGDPLNNLYGGFEYKKDYVNEKTFKTACGMLCKGSFAMTGLSWMGKDWTYENDSPTIHCPHGKCGCTLRERPFRGSVTGVLKCTCPVHPVDEEYRYEDSCEKARKEWEDWKESEKTRFIVEHNHRVCEQHMRFDDETRQWTYHYDPCICVTGFCRAQHCNEACPVLGRPLSREKGNVYYDMRYEGRDYSKDGTLFEGERFEYIYKDRQCFEKPLLLDIAKIYAMQCSKDIAFKARYNSRDFDSMTMYQIDKGAIDMTWEILNVRAEKKVVRDLQQDIEDTKAGIKVFHESDMNRERKSQKKNHRQKLQQDKIRRMEKQILRKGFDGMTVYEKRRIEKMIDDDRIYELDRQHKEIADVVQMSLFDQI